MLMKKICLFVAAVLFTLTTFSQTIPVPNLKKAPSFGVSFFFKDFATPDAINSTSLAHVLGTGAWSKLKDMNVGASFSYYKGLTNNIDFAANLGGSYTTYPFPAASGKARPNSDGFLLEADANMHFKLLTDNYFAVPYFSAGLGLSMYTGTYFAAYMPFGVGMQFRLGGNTFVNLQWDYHVRVTDLANYNFQYSLGIVAPFN